MARFCTFCSLLLPSRPGITVPLCRNLTALAAAQHFARHSVLVSMRLRLAIYGAASLLLLAFYAPARAIAAILASLRQRFLSLGNSSGLRS